MTTSHKLSLTGFMATPKLIEEMQKDLPSKKLVLPEMKKVSGKEAILEILSMAADDDKFLAQMAEDPAKIFSNYDLNWEEKAALGSGDLRLIESWVGKLDKRLSTWIWCRLQQEKW